jgi:hypothetical protein
MPLLAMPKIPNRTSAEIAILGRRSDFAALFFRLIAIAAEPCIYPAESWCQSRLQPFYLHQRRR